MGKMKTILVGALAGVMAATPVLAAKGGVCLQHNRLMSWKAVDQNTLLMTDLEQKQYKVNLTIGCEGLTRGDAKLVFRNWGDLDCLDTGDIITVTSQGLGPRMCSVSSIQAGTPAPSHQ